MTIDIIKKASEQVATSLHDWIVNLDIGAKGIFFDHGHYLEVSNRLDEKDRTSMFDKKFPLIALLEDITEKVIEGSIFESNATVLVCFNTRLHSSSEERHKDVIKPILDPIADELIETIGFDRRVVGYGLNYVRTDRPFYGTRSDNGHNPEKYIFNNIIDVIELNIKLRFIKDNC